MPDPLIQGFLAEARLQIERNVRLELYIVAIERDVATVTFSCARSSGAIARGIPMLVRRANTRRAIIGEVLALPRGGVVLNATIFEADGTIAEMRAPIVLAGGAPPLIGPFDAPMRVALDPRNAPLSLAVAAA
jgi:hypothetical protein